MKEMPRGQRATALRHNPERSLALSGSESFVTPVIRRCKICYNNGQTAVTTAIHNSINNALSKNAIIYRDASPQDYRLTQTADYICEIEPMALKYESKAITATAGLLLGASQNSARNTPVAKKACGLITYTHMKSHLT